MTDEYKTLTEIVQESDKDIVIRFVCLAFSMKLKRYCVAGKILDKDGLTQDWVRPISERKDGALDISDITTEDGSLPSVLDILEIVIRQWVPDACQTENYLISKKSKWRRIGKYNPKLLLERCNFPKPLWTDGYGQGNHLLPQIEENLFSDSLRLIQLYKSQIVVLVEHGKKYIGLEFDYCERKYRLSITDAKIRQQYSSVDEGNYVIDSLVIVCVSVGLTKKSDKFRRKHIASIIPI